MLVGVAVLVGVGVGPVTAGPISRAARLKRVEIGGAACARIDADTGPRRIRSIRRVSLATLVKLGLLHAIDPKR